MLAGNVFCRVVALFVVCVVCVVFTVCMVCVVFTVCMVCVCVCGMYCVRRGGGMNSVLLCLCVC